MVSNEVKSILRDIFQSEKDKPLVWFYLFSKIHKRTSNVPGRPEISNNGTAMENISAFLDLHLENIVSTISHILEDTRDFLQRLTLIGDILENALLVYLMWWVYINI